MTIRDPDGLRHWYHDCPEWNPDTDELAYSPAESSCGRCLADMRKQGGLLPDLDDDSAPPW